MVTTARRSACFSRATAKASRRAWRFSAKAASTTRCAASMSATCDRWRRAWTGDVRRQGRGMHGVTWHAAAAEKGAPREAQEGEGAGAEATHHRRHLRQVSLGLALQVRVDLVEVRQLLHQVAADAVAQRQQVLHVHRGQCALEHVDVVAVAAEVCDHRFERRLLLGETLSAGFRAHLHG